MLIATKLHLPSLRPKLVMRHQLLARLGEALSHPLTLISAPAGFGKTTLVAEWINDFRFQISDFGLPPDLGDAILHAGSSDQNPKSKIQNPKFAWFSLDEGDNDPARFWSYVASALEMVDGGVGQPLLDALQAPNPLMGTPPIEALLAALINGLAATGEQFVLVLDDYHLIHAQPIHDTLQYLLDHQPGNLHLILLTRSDPPLPLARWRVRSQLFELRMAELRFTSGEAAAFLHKTMDLPLAAEEIAALETRTEGWIAGLQLAALSMKGRKDFAPFIQNFTGSNRFVLDYLVDEVLRRQPPALQTFLLQTSLLDSLHPSLCDALTDRHDSRALLQQLERENLFLVPLDEGRTWWRYHHLFADVLRSRLQEAQPEQVPIFHMRIARWLAQNGELSKAVDHALAAADYALAARVIEQSASALLKRGEHKTLRNWLSRLPISVLDSRPHLLLDHALVLVDLHDLDRAERDLDAAELRVQGADPALRQRIVGEAAAIRANIASMRDDMPYAITLAQRALAELPAEEVRLRSEVMVRLGVAYGWQGQVAEATQVYAEAKQLGVEANDLHTALRALMNLGALQSMQGHLPQALAIQQEALAWSAAQGAGQMPILGFAHAELARIFYEWNQLAAAEQAVQTAILFSERGGLVRILADAHILLAMIRQAQGDFGAAYESLHCAEGLIDRYQLPLRYRGFALRTRMLIALTSGDLSATAGWVEQRAPGLWDEVNYPREEERLALAYLLVAEGQYARAVDFLARQIPFAESQERLNRLILMVALKACALRQMGDHKQALATLEAALGLGAAGVYLRAFVDQGETMRLLILDFRFSIERGAYARAGHLWTYTEQLLAAFPNKNRQEDEPQIQNPAPRGFPPLGPKIQNPPDLLSERELEVLRLLADGVSNQEIGETLVVSLNTVKRHVQNIFNKLGANNRVQAVARARELGLSK